MSPSSRVALAAGAASLVVVSAATAFAAPTARHHRPNLVVSAFDLTVAGRSISGTVTVRNIGNARAARSVTSVGGELIATPSLRAGRRARLVVSTSLPAGATRLLMCVDVRHRVRETSETDNCQTYTVPTTVPTAPATGVPGATTTPAPYGGDPTDPPISQGVHYSGGPVTR